jgi:hypothetical protein
MYQKKDKGQQIRKILLSLYLSIGYSDRLPCDGDMLERIWNHWDDHLQHHQSAGPRNINIIKE